jgi:hypothetical protein
MQEHSERNGTMMPESGNYPPGNYPPGNYNPYMPGGAGPIPPAAPPARKKKRVFMWFFIAVQVIFVILIIMYATESTGPSHSQIVSGCYNHAWYPLFKSQADCVTHYGGALNDAGHAGQAIGIGLVIGLWVAADVILGIGRLIVVFARRGSK